MNKDLYLGIIHTRPITSVQCREKLFEQLAKDIKYNTTVNIIITGDFNARTGDKFDFVIEDDTSGRYDVPLPDCYVHDKYINNRNSTSNAYGKCLLEVWKNSSLRIMNGQTLGDLFGNCTYYKNDNKKAVWIIQLLLLLS